MTVISRSASAKKSEKSPKPSPKSVTKTPITPNKKTKGRRYEYVELGKAPLSSVEA